MDQAMVEAAEQGQVRQLGFTAGGPMLQVMTGGPVDGSIASGEPATAVAHS